MPSHERVRLFDPTGWGAIRKRLCLDREMQESTLRAVIHGVLS